VPKIGGFPLTLIVALTTVLRTTVLHCDSVQFYVFYSTVQRWCRYRNNLYNGRFRSDGNGPSVISGLAWIGAACNGKQRTSVNKEFGQYGSIATGAHELGHKYALRLFIYLFYLLIFSFICKS